jgi:glycosyltransferase involved in cell wall biosynthesis
LVANLEVAQVKVFIRASTHFRKKSKKPIHVLFDQKTYALLSSAKNFGLRILPSAVRLSRFIKKEKIDLVHGNMSLESDLAAVLASRLAGVPCICHVRSFEEISLFSKIGARFVAYFICISRAVKDHYLKQGIPEAKLTIIHNGIDLETSLPDERDRPEGGTWTVASLGRMVPWKGQKVLLKAIPPVLDRLPNVRFIFMGDGPDREKLEQEARRLNVQASVEFRPASLDVRALISEADLVVHTSIDPEPFGLVIIEAMARRRAVIATNRGGPLEIITDGQDGLLIEPRNSRLLAEKIIQLLENAELRLRLGRAARRTVEERFNLVRSVRKVEEIYERLIG